MSSIHLLLLYKGHNIVFYSFYNVNNILIIQINFMLLFTKYNVSDFWGDEVQPVCPTREAYDIWQKCTFKGTGLSYYLFIPFVETKLP